MQAYIVLMRTTIAISSDNRDRLLDLKRQWHLRSTDDVVARLLEGPVLGARALYQQHRAAVDAVAKEHGLERIVAFGSRARGDAGPDSDLDLAARFPADADLFHVMRAQDALTRAFGVPVNLIQLEGARSRLRQAIEEDGVVLVG